MWTRGEAVGLYVNGRLYHSFGSIYPETGYIGLYIAGGRQVRVRGFAIYDMTPTENNESVPSGGTRDEPTDLPFEIEVETSTFQPAAPQ